MFAEALFLGAKIGKQPEWPSTVEEENHFTFTQQSNELTRATYTREKFH